MIRFLLCGLLLVGLAGCGQEDVARVREGAALADGAETVEGAFAAEVVLCRRVGSKTGKRIAIGDAFEERPEKKDRYIHAFLDVTGASVGVHQVHLVWIKPGGKEMFRKSAEVTVAAAEDGFTTDVTWFKAEDLHADKTEDTVVSETPDFTLSTRLNVSPDKLREPGEYAFRAYWNRELLIDKPFSFAAPDRS